MERKEKKQKSAYLNNNWMTATMFTQQLHSDWLLAALYWNVVLLWNGEYITLWEYETLFPRRHSVWLVFSIVIGMWRCFEMWWVNTTHIISWTAFLIMCRLYTSYLYLQMWYGKTCVLMMQLLLNCERYNICCQWIFSVCQLNL